MGTRACLDDGEKRESSLAFVGIQTLDRPAKVTETE